MVSWSPIRIVFFKKENASIVQFNLLMSAAWPSDLLKAPFYGDRVITIAWSRFNSSQWRN